MPGLGSGYSKAGAFQEGAVGASAAPHSAGDKLMGPKSLKTSGVGLQTSRAAKITRGWGRLQERSTGREQPRAARGGPLGGREVEKGKV